MVYFTIADYCVYHCKWCVLPLQMVCFTIADGVFYHCRCALPVPNDVAVACFTNARWYVLPMPDGVADPRFPLFGFYCCWILLLFVLIFEYVLPIPDGMFYQCQMVCFTITGGVLLPVPDGMFHHYRWCTFTSARWCVLPLQMMCSARWYVLPIPDDVFYQCQMVFYQCQMMCFTNARWCVLPMPDHVSLHL